MQELREPDRLRELDQPLVEVEQGLHQLLVRVQSLEVEQLVGVEQGLRQLLVLLQLLEVEQVVEVEQDLVHHHLVSMEALRAIEARASDRPYGSSSDLVEVADSVDRGPPLQQAAPRLEPNHDDDTIVAFGRPF